MDTTSSDAGKRMPPVCGLPCIALYTSVLLLLFLPTGAFPWTMCITSCLLSLSLVLAYSVRKNEAPEPPVAPSVFITVGLAIVFIGLYLFPIPLLLTKVAPHVHDQNKMAFDALEKASNLGLLRSKPSALFAITRNKAGTIRMLLSAITAAGAFFAAAGLSTNGKRRFISFLWLCAAGVAIAGCIGQWFIPQESTLWWRIPVPKSLPGPVACFRSRNHYGAFLTLLSPIGLAMFFDSIAKRRLLRSAVTASTLLFVGAAVFLSLSRGAMLSFSIGIAIALALFISAGSRKKLLPVLFVLCIVAFGISASPRKAVRERIDSFRSINETDSYKTRMGAWVTSLRIWKAYPMWGAGPNGFRMVYPQYRATSESSFVTHPENEYAQLLADTGLSGVLMAALILIFLIKRLVVPALSTPDKSALGLVGGAALGIAAFNSVVDFPLHSPIYLAVLASLVGTLKSDSSIPTETRLAQKFSPALFSAVPSICLLLAIAVSIPCWRYQRLDSPSHMRNYEVHQLAKALQWAPTSWYAWYLLGYHSSKMKQPGSLEFAEHCMRNTVHYDPNNYKMWRALGKIQVKRGDTPSARESFARVKALKSWASLPELPENKE